MKSIVAKHGLPEIARSDNGTQFSQPVGSSYKRLAVDYSFKTVTSSPHYSQNNGFIEN